MKSIKTIIKQSFHKHTPNKTVLKTVGRGYGSKQIQVPAKNSHCTKCGKAL